MTENPLLRIAVKVLFPYIFIYGLYVQLHGHYGPGGGFQAGVILSAGFVFYALVYGLDETQRVLPPRIAHVCLASGFMLYASIGVLSMLFGGTFLDYDVLGRDRLEGQYWGIWWVEIGVIVTVFGAMVSIFYAVAGRRKVA